MRIRTHWLCVVLAASVFACDGTGDHEGDGELPAVHAAFPSVPQSGATQTFEVSPCYSISLPYDMARVAVQGIDSSVARFDSASTRVLSDCGGYDMSYGIDPVAQQDVVVDGYDGVLSRYVGSFDQGDQVFSQVVVLHVTRPGGFNGLEHLDVAVYSSDPGVGASLGIIASVRDIWP